MTQTPNDLKQELAELLAERDRRTRENKLATMFPDEGDFSRDKYPKQMLFFKAGAHHIERAFIGGNRSGKTVAGSYEMTLHLTGLYPKWWEGKRFNGPINAWAVGKSKDTTRDTIQTELLGPMVNLGTGMIPKHLIVGKPLAYAGVAQAVDKVYIQHKSGGLSELSFKSYDQDTSSFMGTAKHVIWLDEEPEKFSIYTECLTRIMTTSGILYLTYTPLSGLSDVVLSFLPGGMFPPDGIVPEDYVLDLNRD